MSEPAWTAAFAADLHLAPGEPQGIERARRFIELCAARTRELWLLGDVFDVWTSGVELGFPEFDGLFAAVRRATAGGLRIRLLAGNRDFNFTAADGRTLGVEVPGEEEVEVNAGGRRVRLLHGDQLLLDDLAYQRLKRVLRSGTWRFLARRLPDVVGRWLARRIRRYSDRAVAEKPVARFRIVPAAVEARFTGGVTLVLCGHVHRLQRVDYGAGRELVVLPPFFESGEAVVLADGRFGVARLDGTLRELPPPAAPEIGPLPRPRSIA